MIEWIIPNAQKNSMEPVRLTLKPGGSSDTHLPHAGEEFGYVLKGTVRVFTVEELILSGRRIFLFPGGEKTSAGK